VIAEAVGDSTSPHLFRPSTSDSLVPARYHGSGVPRPASTNRSMRRRVPHASCDHRGSDAPGRREVRERDDPQFTARCLPSAAVALTIPDRICPPIRLARLPRRLYGTWVHSIPAIFLRQLARTMLQRGRRRRTCSCTSRIALTSEISSCGVFEVPLVTTIASGQTTRSPRDRSKLRTGRRAACRGCWGRQNAASAYKACIVGACLRCLRLRPFDPAPGRFSTTLLPERLAQRSGRNSPKVSAPPPGAYPTTIGSACWDSYVHGLRTRAKQGTGQLSPYRLMPPPFVDRDCRGHPI